VISKKTVLAAFAETIGDAARARPAFAAGMKKAAKK
jgi:hypothetical protein